MDLFYSKILLIGMAGMAVFAFVYAFMLSRKGRATHPGSARPLSRWSPFAAFVMALILSFIVVTAFYLWIVL